MWFYSHALMHGYMMCGPSSAISVESGRGWRWLRAELPLSVLLCPGVVCSDEDLHDQVHRLLDAENLVWHLPGSSNARGDDIESWGSQRAKVLIGIAHVRIAWIHSFWCFCRSSVELELCIRRMVDWLRCAQEKSPLSYFWSSFLSSMPWLDMRDAWRASQEWGF